VGRATDLSFTSLDYAAELSPLRFACFCGAKSWPKFCFAEPSPGQNVDSVYLLFSKLMAEKWGALDSVYPLFYDGDD
jgi:hypothetical protein